MRIKLTLEKAAKARGVKTQKQLRKLIKKETGKDMRAATISDLYRDNKTSINKDHLCTIMQALDVTDFNEVLTIE